MTPTPDQPQATSKEVIPQKATLSQFIDEHSKLITGIAAFIALTVFASQLSTQGENTKEVKLSRAVGTTSAAIGTNRERGTS